MSSSEPQLILKKRLKLQWATGEPLVATLHGLEYPKPYTLSLLLMGERTSRIDVLKQELANELTAWLSGVKLKGQPALVIPNRIEEEMLNFIKFGRPPNQRHIYLWILSRTVITWEEETGMRLMFGGVSSTAAIPPSTTDFSDIPDAQAVPETEESSLKKAIPSKSSMNGEKSTYRMSRETGIDYQNSENNFSLTQDILGKSSALSQLQQEVPKGRESARPTFIRLGWTEDHYRLTNEISSRRHEIENVMEERRKVLEVAKARQKKTAKTYATIRDSNQTNRSNYNWARDASNEVINLGEINAAIAEDIQRQKCRAERTTEHIRWTMAPNGFVNRRGRHTKGFVLGPGPLPPNATTSLRDPRIEKTLKNFHWDEHGRRHLRRPNDVTPGSDIEKALCLIKKASTNPSLYKLNLKKVFLDMDTSGDGFVSLEEMRCFFDTVGLRLDDKLIDALFSHFDPNGSGSVHYGEFCWAFFNRRGLINQWKQKTKGLTNRQIKSKFQCADKNGNGVLTRREFAKLLKSFSIKLSDMEIDLLIDRFDKDGDGELDLNEFTAFINSEVNPPANNDSDNAALSGQPNRPLSRSKYHRGNNIDANKTEEIRFNDEQTDTSKTQVADYARDGRVDINDVVNPTLLTQIFSQQAKIEAMLGPKYYKQK